MLNGGEIAVSQAVRLRVLVLFSSKLGAYSQYTTEKIRAHLDQIINMRHAIVRLADMIDWNWIEDAFLAFYSDVGRPAVPTRFMVGLLLLKHIHGPSDEGVCERWVSDPYFKYFIGEEFLEHDVSTRCERSHRVGQVR